jgi:hypothetical protein
MRPRAWWVLAALGAVLVYAVTRPHRCHPPHECAGCRQCWGTP